MMQQLSNFAARDVETPLHPTTHLVKHRQAGPLAVECAQGVHVWDISGNRIPLNT